MASKRNYYVTCMPGLEPVVEELLRRERGVAVEWVRAGGALLRAEQTPDFAYLHDVYLVLHSMTGLTSLDEAVKRLLLRGEWLDRMPFDRVQGKRFRIVAMDRDRLVSLNMKYLALLEQVIVNHTGMTVLRERPDVELWLLRGVHGTTVFGWRLSARRGARQGTAALRPDLCAVAAALAKAGGRSALCVAPAQESGLVRALAASGCKRLWVAGGGAAGGVPGAQAAGAGMLAETLPTGAADAVLACTREPQAFTRWRELLAGWRRVLRAEGRLVLLAPRAALDGSEDMEALGLALEAHYACASGGHGLSLWVMRAVQTDAPTAPETDA